MMRSFLLLSILLCSAISLTAQQTYRSEIEALGFSLQSLDLSDSVKLKVPQPSLAYVNLISDEGMPTSHRAELHDWVEYYDPLADVYFRKRVVANLQGQSSMDFPKQNVAIDFCEDEWLCDSVPTVTFDGWVKQDAFHLKAFYADWLRGVGIVGYQLFDEMEQQMPEDRNRIWKRAGVDGNKKSRCYPDGFPCAFFVNGEFYGIYSWQLKKHRRNMAMDKHQETQIHLDGYLSEDNFWNGTIKWSSFEVRNPKGLTDIDGNPYLCDAPKELSDGVVKESIVALSRCCSNLAKMQTECASDERIREEIAAHFDVETMLNYILFGMVVSNYDGFGKNWQWLTYDGVKWYVAPYDLDCTFGNFHAGTFVFPAELTYINSTFTMNKTRPGIVRWFWAYYFDELTQRYFELRREGIFSKSHITELIHKWYERIGEDLYRREWNRWPDSYCISETIVNDGWEATEDWLWYYGLSEWNAEKTYHKNDRCRLDNRVWKAKEENTGIFPYVQLGYTDSLERLEEWIALRLELVDGYFGYEATAIEECEDPIEMPNHMNANISFGLDGTRAGNTTRGFIINTQGLEYSK